MAQKLENNLEDTRKLGPCSETQQAFLQNTSKFCIYGGGAGQSARS
jgi:hypothetical protein